MSAPRKARNVQLVEIQSMQRACPEPPVVSGVEPSRRKKNANADGEMAAGGAVARPHGNAAATNKK